MPKRPYQTQNAFSDAKRRWFCNYIIPNGHRFCAHVWATNSELQQLRTRLYLLRGISLLYDVPDDVLTATLEQLDPIGKPVAFACLELKSHRLNAKIEKGMIDKIRETAAQP